MWLVDMSKEEIYKDALIRLAAFTDTSAGSYLDSSGSYAGFDEPNAVQISRIALREAEEFAFKSTDKLLRDLKTKRAVGGGNMIVYMVMDEAHDEILRLQSMLSTPIHSHIKIKNRPTTKIDKQHYDVDSCY
jgi:hypothetical protein